MTRPTPAAARPRPRPLEQLGDGQVAGQDQQHDEGVHAGLGGVPGRERARRRAGPQPTRPRSARPAGGRPATPAAGRRRAKRPGRNRTARSPSPNTLHPAVEQDVEERRGAVVAQALGQLAEREPGDADRLGLVEPQGRDGGEADDDGQDQDEAGGHGQPRRARARRGPSGARRRPARGGEATASVRSMDDCRRTAAQPPRSGTVTGGRDGGGGGGARRARRGTRRARCRAGDRRSAPGPGGRRRRRGRCRRG